jgi:plasmid maintenance system antidote protein VapI
MKTARIRRMWLCWLNSRDVCLEHIAITLNVPLETIERDFSLVQQRSSPWPWPFLESDEAAARRRAVIGNTANKVRRLTGLGYKPSRIAELLLLEPAAVSSFIRRTRRLRGKRGDRQAPGDVLRPRSKSNDQAARLAARRALERRSLREAQAPPPGWSFKDRGASARAHAAALLAAQTAIREGRLSNAEMLTLAAVAYFAGPAELPEPAIWTGPESYQIGAPKLDSKQVELIHELRRAGWSTGKLARRFGVTRSTICNVLLQRTTYPPPCPAPALILPTDARTPGFSAGKQGLIVPAPWRDECADS